VGIDEWQCKDVSEEGSSSCRILGVHNGVATRNHRLRVSSSGGERISR
jgi:hypothetical protein